MSSERLRLSSRGPERRPPGAGSLQTRSLVNLCGHRFRQRGDRPPARFLARTVRVVRLRLRFDLYQSHRGRRAGVFYEERHHVKVISDASARDELTSSERSGTTNPSSDSWHLNPDRRCGLCPHSMPHQLNEPFGVHLTYCHVHVANSLAVNASANCTRIFAPSHGPPGRSPLNRHGRGLDQRCPCTFDR